MGRASARKRLRQNSAAPSYFGAKGALGESIWSQLVLALVALMLLATSLGLCAFSVGPTLYDWSRMRHWQPVPAQVESVRLHKGGTARGGSYYTAVVRYRYQAEGLQYTGTRAAVDASGDGWRSFHQQLADRLHNAQRTGTPVQVWVDPQDQAESVVDRSLRVGPLVLNLGIAGLAGGAGLVLSAMVRALWRERRRHNRRQVGAKNAG